MTVLLFIVRYKIKIKGLSGPTLAGIYGHLSQQNNYKIQFLENSIFFNIVFAKVICIMSQMGCPNMGQKFGIFNFRPKYVTMLLNAAI